MKPLEDMTADALKILAGGIFVTAIAVAALPEPAYASSTNTQVKKAGQGLKNAGKSVEDKLKKAGVSIENKFKKAGQSIKSKLTKKKKPLPEQTVIEMSTTEFFQKYTPLFWQDAITFSGLRDFGSKGRFYEFKLVPTAGAVHAGRKAGAFTLANFYNPFISLTNNDIQISTERTIEYKYPDIDISPQQDIGVKRGTYGNLMDIVISPNSKSLSKLRAKRAIMKTPYGYHGLIYTGDSLFVLQGPIDTGIVGSLKNFVIQNKLY